MVRVIPVLLILAVAWWLAAPDPVTAGARTAVGTGAAAAGAGIRDHWSSGRDSRALTRTNRRDRWSKGGGFWRNLLRLEHGAVITGKGVKGVAGITRAAVKPVPAAVKAGWVSGRDRHRAKAGNRPVPVALDPPWWRREQPQVQPEEQATEQPAEQVEVQTGGGPAEQAQASGGQVPEPTRPSPLAGVVKTTIVHAPSAHPSGIPGEQRCEWCEERPQETKRGKLAVCRICAEEIDGQVAAAKAAHPPVKDSTDLPAGNSPQVLDWDTRTNIPPEWRCQRCDSGRYRYTYDGVRVCSACAAELDRLADGSPEEQIRSRRTPAWSRIFPEPLTESDRRFWTERDAGGARPLDRDGRPGDPDLWPFKTDPDPVDTTTGQTVTPTPTEGARTSMGLRDIIKASARQTEGGGGGVTTMTRPASGGGEVDDLATLQRIAAQVVQQHEDSEFMKIIRMCQTLPESTDFGNRVGKTLAEFAQLCVSLGKVGDEVAEMAPGVANIAQHVRGEA